MMGANFRSEKGCPVEEITNISKTLLQLNQRKSLSNLLQVFLWTVFKGIFLQFPKLA